jgi:predicted nucleic acid-binding protein
VLAFFDRFVQVVADPPPVALARPLHCTDPDDQKFIDLALSVPGSWLVSRDRAVLKLRRRAALAAGVHIVRPDEWEPTGLA